MLQIQGIGCVVRTDMDVENLESLKLATPNPNPGEPCEGIPIDEPAPYISIVK
jgi:hypothetical protein